MVTVIDSNTFSPLVSLTTLLAVCIVVWLTCRLLEGNPSMAVFFDAFTPITVATLFGS